MNRDAVVAALAAFPVRLREAVHAAADRSVPAGTWTPAQIVRHLIACETDVHQARLADLTTVASPTWGWVEPGPWTGEPEVGLEALLDRFAGLRASTLTTVGALDDAGWALTGTHRTFGAFDVQALLGSAADHDEHHLAGLTG